MAGGEKEIRDLESSLFGCGGEVGGQDYWPGGQLQWVKGKTWRPGGWVGRPEGLYNPGTY